MNDEMPSVTSTAYASSTITLDEASAADSPVTWVAGAQPKFVGDLTLRRRPPGVGMQGVGAAVGAAIGGYVGGGLFNENGAEAILPIKKGVIQMPQMRIVKVFIADPDENIPLASRLLHQGEEQLTDATDQELYFEIPMASLLRSHNTLRGSTIDKKASKSRDKDVFLEPIRVRDLKMVVVNIAVFPAA